MTMIRYGASYSNKDWKCRNCQHVFRGPATVCPKCKSDSIYPIPNVLTEKNDK